MSDDPSIDTSSIVADAAITGDAGVRFLTISLLAIMSWIPIFAVLGAWLRG